MSINQLSPSSRFTTVSSRFTVGGVINLVNVGDSHIIELFKLFVVIDDDDDDDDDDEEDEEEGMVVVKLLEVIVEVIEEVMVESRRRPPEGDWGPEYKRDKMGERRGEMAVDPHWTHSTNWIRHPCSSRWR